MPSNCNFGVLDESCHCMLAGFHEQWMGGNYWALDESLIVQYSDGQAAVSNRLQTTVGQLWGLRRVYYCTSEYSIVMVVSNHLQTRGQWTGGRGRCVVSNCNFGPQTSPGTTCWWSPCAIDGGHPSPNTSNGWGQL